MEGNNKGLTWFLLLLFKKKKWGEWGRQREKGRIRWKKRRWFKLLMDLKQTEFGNQFLSDSWFGRTSLVWIKEIGKKKKRKDLLMLTAFPQALFHLFRNWKCFPTPSSQLSTPSVSTSCFSNSLNSTTQNIQTCLCLQGSAYIPLSQKPSFSDLLNW